MDIRDSSIDGVYTQLDDGSEQRSKLSKGFIVSTTLFTIAVLAYLCLAGLLPGISDVFHTSRDNLILICVLCIVLYDAFIIFRTKTYALPFGTLFVPAPSPRWYHSTIWGISNIPMFLFTLLICFAACTLTVYTVSSALVSRVKSVPPVLSALQMGTEVVTVILIVSGAVASVCILLRSSSSSHHRTQEESEYSLGGEEDRQTFILPKFESTFKVKSTISQTDNQNVNSVTSLSHIHHNNNLVASNNNSIMTKHSATLNNNISSNHDNIDFKARVNNTNVYSLPTRRIIIFASFASFSVSILLPRLLSNGTTDNYRQEGRNWLYFHLDMSTPLTIQEILQACLSVCLTLAATPACILLSTLGDLDSPRLSGIAKYGWDVIDCESKISIQRLACIPSAILRSTYPRMRMLITAILSLLLIIVALPACPRLLMQFAPPAALIVVILTLSTPKGRPWWLLAGILIFSFASLPNLIDPSWETPVASPTIETASPLSDALAVSVASHPVNGSSRYLRVPSTAIGGTSSNLTFISIDTVNVVASLMRLLVPIAFLFSPLPTLSLLCRAPVLLSRLSVCRLPLPLIPHNASCDAFRSSKWSRRTFVIAQLVAVGERIFFTVVVSQVLTSGSDVSHAHVLDGLLASPLELSIFPSLVGLTIVLMFTVFYTDYAIIRKCQQDLLERSKFVANSDGTDILLWEVWSVKNLTLCLSAPFVHSCEAVRNQMLVVSEVSAHHPLASAVFLTHAGIFFLMHGDIERARDLLSRACASTSSLSSLSETISFANTILMCMSNDLKGAEKVLKSLVVEGTTPVGSQMLLASILADEELLLLTSCCSNFGSHQNHYQSKRNNHNADGHHLSPKAAIGGTESKSLRLELRNGAKEQQQQQVKKKRKRPSEVALQNDNDNGFIYSLMSENQGDSSNQENETEQAAARKIFLQPTKSNNNKKISPPLISIYHSPPSLISPCNSDPAAYYQRATASAEALRNALVLMANNSNSQRVPFTTNVCLRVRLVASLRCSRAFSPALELAATVRQELAAFTDKYLLDVHDFWVLSLFEVHLLLEMARCASLTNDIDSATKFALETTVLLLSLPPPPPLEVTLPRVFAAAEVRSIAGLLSPGLCELRPANLSLFVRRELAIIRCGLLTLQSTSLTPLAAVQSAVSDCLSNAFNAVLDLFGEADSVSVSSLPTCSLSLPPASSNNFIPLLPLSHHQQQLHQQPSNTHAAGGGYLSTARGIPSVGAGQVTPIGSPGMRVGSQGGVYYGAGTGFAGGGISSSHAKHAHKRGLSFSNTGGHKTSASSVFNNNNNNNSHNLSQNVTKGAGGGGGYVSFSNNFMPNPSNSNFIPNNLNNNLLSTISSMHHLNTPVPPLTVNRGSTDFTSLSPLDYGLQHYPAHHNHSHLHAPHHHVFNIPVPHSESHVNCLTTPAALHHHVVNQPILAASVTRVISASPLSAAELFQPLAAAFLRTGDVETAFRWAYRAWLARRCLSNGLGFLMYQILMQLGRTDVAYKLLESWLNEDAAANRVWVRNLPVSGYSWLGPQTWEVFDELELLVISREGRFLWGRHLRKEGKVEMARLFLREVRDLDRGVGMLRARFLKKIHHHHHHHRTNTVNNNNKNLIKGKSPKHHHHHHNHHQGKKQSNNNQNDNQESIFSSISSMLSNNIEKDNMPIQNNRKRNNSLAKLINPSKEAPLSLVSLSQHSLSSMSSSASSQTAANLSRRLLPHDIVSLWTSINSNEPSRGNVCLELGRCDLDLGDFVAGIRSLEEARAILLFHSADHNSSMLADGHTSASAPHIDGKTGEGAGIDSGNFLSGDPHARRSLTTTTSIPSAFSRSLELDLALGRARALTGLSSEYFDEDFSLAIKHATSLHSVALTIIEWCKSRSLQSGGAVHIPVEWIRLIAAPACADVLVVAGAVSGKSRAALLGSKNSVGQLTAPGAQFDTSGLPKDDIKYLLASAVIVVLCSLRLVHAHNIFDESLAASPDGSNWRMTEATPALLNPPSTAVSSSSSSADSSSSGVASPAPSLGSQKSMSANPAAAAVSSAQVSAVSSPGKPLPATGALPPLWPLGQVFISRLAVAEVKGALPFEREHWKYVASLASPAVSVHPDGPNPSSISRQDVLMSVVRILLPISRWKPLRSNASPHILSTLAANRHDAIRGLTLFGILQASLGLETIAMIGRVSLEVTLRLANHCAVEVERLTAVIADLKAKRHRQVTAARQTHQGLPIDASQLGLVTSLDILVNQQNINSNNNNVSATAKAASLPHSCPSTPRASHAVLDTSHQSVSHAAPQSHSNLEVNNNDNNNQNNHNCTASNQNYNAAAVPVMAATHGGGSNAGCMVAVPSPLLDATEERIRCAQEARLSLLTFATEVLQGALNDPEVPRDFNDLHDSHVLLAHLYNSGFINPVKCVLHFAKALEVIADARLSTNNLLVQLTDLNNKRTSTKELLKINSINDALYLHGLITRIENEMSIANNVLRSGVLAVSKVTSDEERHQVHAAMDSARSRLLELQNQNNPALQT